MKIIDLFSGIGGFSLGFQRAGYQFTEHYFSEIDKHAIANYKYNFPNAKHIGDITTLHGGDFTDIDIITFGSPCQDFSLAGKREGLKGAKSSLIKKAIALIAHVRPSIFIWENVKGAFSSNARADFWAIIQALANIGCYRLEWQLLNTSWLLPQNRERIYLIGLLAGRSESGVFPIQEDDFLYSEKTTSQLQAQISTTLKANGNMNADDTYIQVGTYRTHNDGRGFREVKKNIAPTIPARARQDGSGMPVIRQLPRGNNKGADFKICPTISSNAFQENNLLNGVRRLTEIECERLQGFPDNWTQYGDYNGIIKPIAKTQRYKLIGNAVTVDIVTMIAKRLKFIENEKPTCNRIRRA
ncbi:DNA cytosine methyltransferase [uncultured Capnocytophaga sp.]|uniref:DNA cytosine methyltransferase n=1 Tax=uncultured Capnocytophaga sp. TaxID=159273 RepID=UPI0028ECBF79|nr:DNA cytosine methyltransferase [uncultured Capnocytophaga sp.]